MKTYFNFLLKGEKLFLYWIIMFVAVIVPYIGFIFAVFKFSTNPSNFGYFLLVFPLMFIIIAAVIYFSYYRIKLTIEGISYENENLKFDGQLGSFFGTYLLGFFLSMITLGIYTAWFARNIQAFIVDNTSYRGEKFKFLGEGSQLFLILLFTLVIPFIVIYAIMVGVMLSAFTSGSFASGNSLVWIFLIYLLLFFALIPYIYYVYKWMIDARFRDYRITLKAETMPSLGCIAIEFLLSVITLGIYLPLAYLKIYKLFANHTVAKNSESTVKTGYDIQPLNDFLVCWGQLLLTLITLGIYYPWAYARVMRLVACKTYIETSSPAEM